MKHYDIAVLLGFPEISGGTNVILEHALGLTQRGHAVSIVTEMPFDPQRLAWKPAAMCLPLLSHEDLRRTGRVFDLSIATWWRSVFDLPHVPARRYAYFCQSIETRFFSAQDSDLKALADYTYRQPLPVVTEASWIARHLHEYYGRSAALVPNGVEKSIFRPAGPALEPRSADGLRVLVEGPLGVPFKRVELAIDLCRRAGIDDLWLLTSSDCRHYPGVRRVCAKVPINEVGQVLRACDVMVKLSTVEGMFGPPLEMMHCGGTAITTDVTGHEEYMRHGENGIVVRRGAEAEVIQYLRALQRDRAFLNKLKAGALCTASQWPGWPESVRGFEQFVATVCEAEPSLADVQHQMLKHLDAALRLAGPLRCAGKPEYSGRQLLRMAAVKAREKLRRKLVGARRAAIVKREDVAGAVMPVPNVTWERVAPRSHYRICFAGDARRYQAHVPSRADRAAVLLVDVCESPDVTAVKTATAFGPDFTIVFEPELLPVEWLARLPGRLVGFSPQPVDHAHLTAWQARFPLDTAGIRGLLHPDSNAIPVLLAARIATPGPFLLPVDVAGFEQGLSAEDWCARDIDVLFVGPATDANRPFLDALRPLPGFLHLSQPAGDRVLRGVLSRTKMVLHLPERRDDFLSAAKVTRDVLCGALVVAGDLPEAYGLMPGEHYLYCRTPAELLSLVQQELLLHDERHVMRRRAQAEARKHDAGTEWVRILERHFCRTENAVDWAGQRETAMHLEESQRV